MKAVVIVVGYGGGGGGGVCVCVCGGGGGKERERGEREDWSSITRRHFCSLVYVDSNIAKKTHHLQSCVLGFAIQFKTIDKPKLSSIQGPRITMLP